jgi:hypothetical protein
MKKRLLVIAFALMVSANCVSAQVEWEYKVVDTVLYSLRVNVPDTSKMSREEMIAAIEAVQNEKARPTTEALNAAGKDGWELVAAVVIPDTSKQAEFPVTRYIFKRPKTTSKQGSK